MHQQACQKMVFKLHSKQLRKSNWNLTLDLADAINAEQVVTLGDSQLLRFIDEINGVFDRDRRIRSVKREIKTVRRLPISKESRGRIRDLYKELQQLQFQPDYLCLIMDTEKDYDRANGGFTVNGVRYRRFLGTNGGIKNSTIVYVNTDLYDELKRRLDNGRDKTVPLVPAKLEAYQALVCSGSIPIPEPNGIIVVKDCITRFKEDVILIDDCADGEPKLTFERGYEFEHNDSDGFGLMLPSYSRRVNYFLGGNKGECVSGMNTRYAWTKGMVYTFDFLEFAQQVAGSFEVVDVWGKTRDIRDAEVILTESMLKLWMCYDSWEDYHKNCMLNHYEFSVTKTTPDELENVRFTNYQFLQGMKSHSDNSYLTDEEVKQLCKQTFDEIDGALGLDPRKSIAFLTGSGLSEQNAFSNGTDVCARALMAEPSIINDPFIRKKIWRMIVKRIEMAKRGAIQVNGNFAMISGDPYALCQSMFGLPVTGLLKAHEVYHKYWSDRGAKEIACFRAPMTVINNVRRMTLVDSEETRHWYQYIQTALIYNAWDSSCEAMNGADKDGDTNMCTDNPIILRHIPNAPTIVCIQHKAEKKIVTEEDIIKANKLAFNDDIGIVTNHVTSMIERQSVFQEGSKEWNALEYRIMCGEKYQQDTIDRAKGIVANPMPPYWYSLRDTRANDEDDEETAKLKAFNRKIAAAYKPYFMVYVYPALKTTYNKYVKNSLYGAVMRFGVCGIESVEELRTYTPATKEIKNFLKYYDKHMPVGNRPCLVNRICWLAEEHYRTLPPIPDCEPFDPSILKSETDEYDKQTLISISRIYRDYLDQTEQFKKRSVSERIKPDDAAISKQIMVDTFVARCAEVCPNEKVLCNALVDLCYNSSTSKQFVWDVCGENIVDNLLRRNGYAANYPERTNNGGEFSFGGVQYQMRGTILKGAEHSETEAGVN